MDLQVDDTRRTLPNAVHRAATDVTRRAVEGSADAGSTTAAQVGRSPASLRTRLQAVADEVDGLWQDALDSQNLDLVTRAVDASHGIHRALLALGDDRFVIGRARGGAYDAGRVGTVDRASS